MLIRHLPWEDEGTRGILRGISCSVPLRFLRCLSPFWRLPCIWHSHHHNAGNSIKFTLLLVRVLKATLAVDTGTTYSGTARMSKPKTNHEVKDSHRSLQPALPNHHRTSDAYRSGLFKGGSSLETANWNTIC